MICCLLALLAAFPGWSLIRRLRAGQSAPAHCVSAACAVSLQRDIGRAVMAAGAVVVLFGAVLSIHKWSHGMYWQEVAPICSALDRISSVPVLSWRGTASNQ
jgi:hypothetical protein